MVALQHHDEADEAPTTRAAARADVERLEAGLSRALLAAPPDVVRSIAERARRAEASAARWQARVGEEPVLAADAEASVVEAMDEVRAARAAQDDVLRGRHRVLAAGNGAGLVGLGVAGGLVVSGWSPMALPVAVAIAAAPIGPVVSGWITTRRCSRAARRVAVARTRWSEGLEAAGAATMGDLAARRIAVKAWERRRDEAAVAEEAARPHVRAWYRMAGPGVAPDDVDGVLARIEALRQAQLRLLGDLLGEVVEGRAMDVLAPAEEAAEPAAPPSWLSDALTRLRTTNRLRLWST